MSSLRNAVKRHTHKERAQPAHRKKLGLLEKKKDYKVRARDYHDKQKYLGKLRRKAAERNPDEFYFRMIKARTKGGIHQIEAQTDSEEVIKLVRDQNMGYLQVHRGAEASRIEKLRENLHFINTEAAPQNRHTIFVDDDEEAETFDKADYFDTDEAFVDRAFNRPTKDRLKKDSIIVGGDPKSMSRAFQSRKKAYNELEQRIKRKAKMDNALAHMELYKNLSKKGQRFKVQDGKDGKPPVYKWKQERKR